MDRLKIKELKLVGKNVYVARYERTTYVETKPYAADDLEDAQWRAWDAEIKHEVETDAHFFRIDNLTTGETKEFR